MPLLFAATLRTAQILSVAQLLLANTNASATFADILLDFLVGHLEDLKYLRSEDASETGVTEDALERCSSEEEEDCCEVVASPQRKASVVLRLFKIIFGSVTLFEGNETALRGRLRGLITDSLRLASACERPLGYFLFLRALFRSLGTLSQQSSQHSQSTNAGGSTSSEQKHHKLEKSHMEVEAVLPATIRALLRLRLRLEDSPRCASLLTELCLTVPARLDHLVPHVPLLLGPLAHALRQPEWDLASLALRTLEHYLDSLGAAKLKALFSPTPDTWPSILDGVYSHLRPAPYPYGTLALRILGKLGGNNRAPFAEDLPCPSTATANATDSAPLEDFEDEHSDASLQLVLEWRRPAHVPHTRRQDLAQAF